MAWPNRPTLEKVVDIVAAFAVAGLAADADHVYEIMCMCGAP